MVVKVYRRSGHKFFNFFDDGLSREVCFDGWTSSLTCPPFCVPCLCNGWEPLPKDRFLRYTDTSGCLEFTLPTCFGYFTRRGAYRKTGSYHMSLLLDKNPLMQYIYNYIV